MASVTFNQFSSASSLFLQMRTGWNWHKSLWDSPEFGDYSTLAVQRSDACSEEGRVRLPGIEALTSLYIPQRKRHIMCLWWWSLIWNSGSIFEVGSHKEGQGRAECGPLWGLQLWQRGKFFLKATKISLKKNTMIGFYPKIQNIFAKFLPQNSS